MGAIGCPETSAPKHQSTLRNIPEERRSRRLYKSPSLYIPVPINFTLLKGRSGSRDSSVSIVTSLHAGLFGAPVSSRGKIFSLKHHFRFWGPKQPSIGYRIYTPRLKGLEREVDHLSASAAEIKSEGIPLIPHTPS
jgi:hypothetical protein